mgnify:CR=1 FL=1
MTGATHIVASNFFLQERGVALNKEFDLLDEESRYSSVLRTSEDTGDDNDDSSMDLLNNATFGRIALEPDIMVIESNESEICARTLAEGESMKNRPSPSLTEVVSLCN